MNGQSEKPHPAATGQGGKAARQVSHRQDPSYQNQAEASSVFAPVPPERNHCRPDLIDARKRRERKSHLAPGASLTAYEARVLRLLFRDCRDGLIHSIYDMAAGARFHGPSAAFVEILGFLRWAERKNLLPANGRIDQSWRLFDSMQRRVSEPTKGQ